MHVILPNLTLKPLYNRILAYKRCSLLVPIKLAILGGLAAATLILSGCGKDELYTGLTERDANMMIAILLRANIACDKQPGAENTFAVEVDTDRYGAAVEILREYGYPREQYAGVGTAFQKTGLVSSPTEERIRFMYALSQDIASTINRIDGVTDAQVHIVLPDNNPFADVLYPSSAAVFVQYRADSNVESYVSQIKNLVMNSVEGLSYDKVSLAMFSMETQATSNEVSISAAIQQGQQRHTEDVLQNRIMMGAAVLILLAAGSLGFWWWKNRPAKAAKNTRMPSAALPPAEPPAPTS